MHVIHFLQGIGEKMAEYIIDLRTESPVKSVSEGIFETLSNFLIRFLLLIMLFWALCS